MNVPADLKYTPEHEWVSQEEEYISIGITDWAQGELGDVVFVELPQVGAVVERGESFGTIEAVKAVSDLYSPVNGTVVEINALLDDDPMAINRDPFGDGWMIKVKMDNPAQLDDLLDTVGYQNLIDGQ